MHEDLLEQAAFLAERDRTKPKQANLRRAVSSAYYALFHYLVDRACRELLGAQNERRLYRHVVARAFDHGCMKQVCIAFRGGTLPQRIVKALPTTFAVPQDLRSVARTFVEVQEKRHLADYDHSTRFGRSEVKAIVRDAQTAVRTFEAVSDANLRQFFLVCLLTWTTLVKR